MIVFMAALMIFAAESFAQTPVERLISRYADVSGAKVTDAKGSTMSVARVILKRTPVAALAPDVDEVDILKMGGASKQYQMKFKEDLEETLKSYEFHGTHEGKNGMVDIYILPSGKDVVDELVIYNPEILTLNSLQGSFTIEALKKLE